MTKQIGIPVYRQLVNYVRIGFSALDKTVQNEIIAFIKSQQNINGGFMDRAGTPDLYYSMFGLWLSLACNQKELLPELKNYITTKNESRSASAIEDLALLLIKSELGLNSKKLSVLSIIRTVLAKGRMIELSYQFFLISLVVDALGKNKKLYYFFARIWLYFYEPKGNIPCSLTAALVYARKTVGLKINKSQNNLLKFTVIDGGFCAFESVETSDSLSTGIALFVLRETGFDLRIIAPACLDLVQQNYNSGAFLSGDGDQTKDMEYTFYGLLALGSLLKN